CYGIKASFQIIPEKRYTTSDQFMQNIWDRGFEINVHDWNHDGLLFSDYELFLRRVEQINRCATAWGAEAFLSGALSRKLDCCVIPYPRLFRLLHFLLRHLSAQRRSSRSPARWMLHRKTLLYWPHPGNPRYHNAGLYVVSYSGRLFC